jgi:hypothetical protein
MTSEIGFPTPACTAHGLVSCGACLLRRITAERDEARRERDDARTQRDRTIDERDELRGACAVARRELAEARTLTTNTTAQADHLAGMRARADDEVVALRGEVARLREALEGARHSMGLAVRDLTRDSDTSADDLRAIRYPLEAAAERARRASLPGPAPAGEWVAYVEPELTFVNQESSTAVWKGQGWTLRQDEKGGVSVDFSTSDADARGTGRALAIAMLSAFTRAPDGNREKSRAATEAQHERGRRFFSTLPPVLESAMRSDPLVAAHLNMWARDGASTVSLGHALQLIGALVERDAGRVKTMADWASTHPLPIIRPENPHG